MKKLFLFLVAGTALLLAACNKKAEIKEVYYSDEQYALVSQTLNLPEKPDNYTIQFPRHLSNAGLRPNAIDDAKATLGRVLFYDKSLSKDRTVSCASCHLQSAGFSDNIQLSRGVEDRQTTRNSFPLGSVTNFSAYYGTDINGSGALPFFWDNRAATVAEQCRSSMTNPNEMGMSMEQIVSSVRQQPYYHPLFEKAFGNNEINETRILDGLAHFVNAIGSYSSRFDQEASKVGYVDGYSFSGFTPAENLGKELYEEKCSGCHSSTHGRPAQVKSSNGLDLNPVDKGVGAITGHKADMGTFKVPTLRNIALTAPYMHDGRFTSLEEVIDHYSTNIQAHENLGYYLKSYSNGKPLKFNFTQQQKEALIAYLNTLTDEAQATDPRFSNPFR